MAILIVEIELKSGAIVEQTILPRYYNKDCIYQGVVYKKSGFIKDVVPKKALAELQALAKEGSERDFSNRNEIKLWIHERTGISLCSLSSLPLSDC